MKAAEFDFCVVGAGVLGMAAAEALSRAGGPFSAGPRDATGATGALAEGGTRARVVVVRDPSEPGASFAAAANLATKAQFDPRDPHFALKLRGKAAYRDWLRAFDAPETLLETGDGLDVFPSEERATAQWERVRRGDPRSTGVSRPTPATVRYEGEARVDALRLLAALEAALRARGVVFRERRISGAGDLPRGAAGSCYFICAGARSPALLEALGLAPRDPVAGKRLGAARYSAGTVLRVPTGFPEARGEALAGLGAPGLGRPVLLEFPRAGLKVTLSGTHEATYVSSSTVRLDGPGPVDVSSPAAAEWTAQDAILTGVARDLLPRGLEARALRGVRVAFGKAELLATRLRPCVDAQPDARLGSRSGSAIAPSSPGGRGPFDGPDAARAFLLAGAHKSGYLLAPVVGQILQELLAP